MQQHLRGFSKSRRPLNAAIWLAALIFSATCGDSAPVAPESAGPAHASFALAPNFAPLPAGAPTITLSRVQASLTGQHGESLSAEARFNNGSATLTFDVTITGSSATFELEYVAFDLQGVIAYRGKQTITVRAGLNASLPSPTLIYDAPDAKITALRVSPNPVTMPASGTVGLAAVGTLANGQTLTPRVAWTTSSAAVVAVSEDGVLTAGKSQGAATITATSANGLTATVPVKVQAPVDRVTVSPATISIPRGSNATATADVRDATNVAIDDRTPTWTSSDQSVATVSNTGVIAGLKVGRATITAALEGKSGSTSVTVTSPIDRIDLSPGSLNFPSLKTSQQLTATVVPVPGGSAAGLVPEFRSSNSGVASVDNKGVVTSVANGTATITAEVDGVSATASVTVQQAAAVVAILPRVASVSALGATTTFTATVVDAANNPLASPTVAWTSSDPTVATVTGTGLIGTATSVKAGSVTITATVTGKSDNVSFIVAPAAQLLVIQTTAITLALGKTAVVTAFMADANRNPLFEVPARFSTTTPNVISVDGNIVIARSSGIGRVVATYNNLTAEQTITVQGGTGLTIKPDSVEKLLGGTQQFSVAEAGETSQFTWSVNGIPGGNETFGTITQGGFYTAPRTMPTPSTFLVCATQATPPLTGCAKVVLSQIPTGGADVIVINDMNLMQEQYIGTNGNRQFFKNIASFTPVGSRASANKVMFQYGHGSTCGADQQCRAASNATMRADMQTVGITGFYDDVSPTITSIPSDVKVLFIETPTVGYTVAELNVLKNFAGTGGRIVFIGENSSYYGDGIPIENDLLLSLGGQLTNAVAQASCASGWDIDAAHIQPHQVTTNVSSLYVPCAAPIILGPNDYALAFNRAEIGGAFVPVIAVAKIDVTPIVGGPILQLRPFTSILKAAPARVTDKTGLGTPPKTP